MALDNNFVTQSVVVIQRDHRNLVEGDYYPIFRVSIMPSVPQYIHQGTTL
jgi:hypothetical protein